MTVPFYPANILIPTDGFEKWSVIACDQYTSDEKYWKDVENIVIYRNDKCDHTATVALNIKGADSAFVDTMLSRKYGISIRSGGHCAPLMHEAIGTVETGAVPVILAHPGFNIAGHIPDGPIL